MKLDWGEADPRTFLGLQVGWCVRLNGEDVAVWDVWKTHIDVCDWRGVSAPDVPIGDNVRSIPWDEIESLYVY